MSDAHDKHDERTSVCDLDVDDLGRVTNLTHGDWMPNAMESVVIKDHTFTP